MQPTALQESLVDPPWTVHSLWRKMIESVLFAYQLQKLISFKFGLNQTLTSTVVRWAHCSNQPLAIVLLPFSPETTLSRVQPSQPCASSTTAMVPTPGAGLWEIMVRLGNGGAYHHKTLADLQLSLQKCAFTCVNGCCVMLCHYLYHMEALLNWMGAVFGQFDGETLVFNSAASLKCQLFPK